MNSVEWVFKLVMSSGPKVLEAGKSEPTGQKYKPDRLVGGGFVEACQMEDRQRAGKTHQAGETRHPIRFLPMSLKACVRQVK